MKKILIHLCLAIIFSNVCAPGSSLECSGELDPEIEALIDDSLFELQAPSFVQRNCFETVSILSMITPPVEPGSINVVTILQEDIYKSTVGPVTRRSLLDLPAFTPDYFYNNYWSFSAEAFFNFTPRVFFTKDSPFIRDYIDLTNENIINELGNSEFDVPDDIPGILGLFSSIKLQQYRVGLMLSFARQWDNFVLCGRIPLYYLLENFFLTEEEIDRIKNNPFFTNDDGGLGETPEDEARKFALKHIVADKFGTGDTRLSLLAHVYASECQDIWLGLQSTLPTAKTFNSGLIAGEFDPEAMIPPFNLQHFFNVFKCSSNLNLALGVIKKELTDFLVDALDRLSTILINAPLGNGKHFGFGPEINFRYHVNEYFSFHTYSSIQAYLPHKENRYFLIEKKESDFDRDWHNPEQASENLSLINRLIVQTLFPTGIKTTIFPGPRFQINTSALYKSEHWDLSLGLDYWVQGHEKQNNPLPIIPFNLRVNQKKASRPGAHQGKIFANAGYYGTLHSISPDTDWYLCANMDATVFNSGIGQDFSIGIRFGLEF